MKYNPRSSLYSIERQLKGKGNFIDEKLRYNQSVVGHTVVDNIYVQTLIGTGKGI